jgi:hypothetical protein
MMDAVYDFFLKNLNSIVLIVATTAVAAVFNYWSTYRSNVSTAKRAERLNRLNRQLGELYGPVRMLRYAGETAFLTFKRKYFPERPELFWKGVEPSVEDYSAWRIWLKFTLMPINKRIERLLLEHGDLIEGREIPQAVLDYLAHVSALDAVIAQWEQGNFKDFKSGIRYPIEFNEHIEKTYRQLLKRRASHH